MIRLVSSWRFIRNYIFCKFFFHADFALSLFNNFSKRISFKICFLNNLSARKGSYDKPPYMWTSSNTSLMRLAIIAITIFPRRMSGILGGPVFEEFFFVEKSSTSENTRLEEPVRRKYAREFFSIDVSAKYRRPTTVIRRTRKYVRYHEADRTLYGEESRATWSAWCLHGAGGVE